MGDKNLSSSQLRDLIINFYTVNDPQRLEDGIDVNGMVTWTVENGLSKLNGMLTDTYGFGIDPKKANDMNTKQGIERVSRALTGNVLQQIQATQLPALDQALEKRINAFYKRLEPKKLGHLTKVVQFAMYKGEEALNAKLRDKYGVDLTDYDNEPSESDSGSSDDGGEANDTTTAAVVPIAGDKPGSSDNKAKSVVSEPKAVAEVEHKKTSVVSAKSNTETTGGEKLQGLGAAAVTEPENTWKMEVIEDELERFYKAHDPDKIVVLEALVTWASMIGRVEFNKKMIQLYGSTLDDPLPEPKAVTVSIKVKAKSERTVKSDDNNATKPDPDIQELERQETIAETSPKAKTPVKAKPNAGPLKVVTNEEEKPSYVSFQQAMAASVRKADPLKGPKLIKNVKIKKEEGACDQYRLDMTSNFFGVCKCGFPKTSHTSW